MNKRWAYPWCWVFVMIVMPFVQAEETPTTDEVLLEDLSAELLEPEHGKPLQPLDQRLLEQLGEDVGARKQAKDDWLKKVVHHMQAARTILEQAEDLSRATDAQAEALAGLDAMIAEITERKSQCSGGKCDKPGQPKPGKKPGSSNQAGKSPGKAAAEINKDADLSTHLAVAGELIKDLWGQLPERQREQILQPLGEKFLPKYADEIEAYFRALAEPKRSRPEAK